MTDPDVAISKLSVIYPPRMTIHKRFTLLSHTFIWSVIFSAVAQLSWANPSGAAGVSQQTTGINSGKLSVQDYTFGYWQNGMRKHRDNQSADVLCLETGYYGLSLDLAKLHKPKFEIFNEALDYEAAINSASTRMGQLSDAQLNIEFEQNGRIYRATRCSAVAERLAEGRMLSARMWESARLTQHYDFAGLEFTDDQGGRLITDARLDVVAWPQSVTFNLEMEPTIELVDGVQQGLNGKGQGVLKESLLIPHQPTLEHEQFTAEAWIKVPEAAIHKNRSWVFSKNGNEGSEGYFGIGIKGDSITAGINIGGVDRRNYREIRTNRHSLSADKWIHVAMTYDGKKLAVYLNGREQNSIEVNKKRVLDNSDMRIGRKADNRGSSAHIIVDQLRLWNKVLDQNSLIRHARHPNKEVGGPNLTYVNNFENAPDLKLPLWQNSKVRISFNGSGKKWAVEKSVSDPWGVGQNKKFTLHCGLSNAGRSGYKVQASMLHNKPLQVDYRDDFGCNVASIKRPKRKGKSGYNDIRDYDEVDITVDSSNGDKVPFLMEIFGCANITGVCPILCDEKGSPTGIPVQISKNWHNSGMGDYLRAYVLLPAVKGVSKYKLKFVYGFYGKLPSASHAQLSLVGYGGHGRWDQLAIGCWGETYCMDIDMSCVDVAVTDVRMLMSRNGKNGEKWQWTDAGWGGDWLGLNDEKKQKHFFNGVKTAYLSHGPCLTEVKYGGAYGAQKEINVDSTVRTLRTDDYARTFTTLDYSFNKKTDASGWLFKMGRTGGYITPKVAYGNVNGLINEQSVPKGLKRETAFIPRTTLSGPGPWWVSFPGAYHESDRDWGTGYRAMVIRSYKAVIGGKVYNNPTIECPVFWVSKDQHASLDFYLSAPEGVAEFAPGDKVSAELEWITLHRSADDYYGPNEAYRQHLKALPSSWQTTHREAKGNNLRVTVEGGALKHNYPVIISVEKPEVVATIQGGVGCVPIRFEGLPSPHGYGLYRILDGKEQKLDQSVHGNDFWQTDYDARSNSYKITYNLPLDGINESKWKLKKIPAAKPAPTGTQPISTQLKK